MTKNDLTEKQQAALAALQSGPKVLHVGIGGALVAHGLATKDTTSGHGKLMGSYRLVRA